MALFTVVVVLPALLYRIVYPFEDNAAIVCNDEGKINGMPLNRALYMEGENGLRKLHYKKLFYRPEFFLLSGKEITAILYDPEKKKLGAATAAPKIFKKRKPRGLTTSGFGTA